MHKSAFQIRCFSGHLNRLMYYSSVVYLRWCSCSTSLVFVLRVVILFVSFLGLSQFWWLLPNVTRVSVFIIHLFHFCFPSRLFIPNINREQFWYCTIEYYILRVQDRCIYKQKKRQKKDKGTKCIQFMLFNIK